MQCRFVGSDVPINDRVPELVTGEPPTVSHEGAAHQR
jgi:hypothetical protein